MMYAVETSRLIKNFYHIEKGKRKTVEAVNGVSLTVNQGEIFGFLGPNGAGKTTTMRMLTTLLRIDQGEAKVAGFDIRKNPAAVRQHIGFVGQLGGADIMATGRENLMLSGQLYGMSKEKTVKRTDECIKSFNLEENIDRQVSTYSGGQKRRLELALGIMHEPEVLFLDEPTTGLDPQNRANLWEQIRHLRNSGTTVFLTTHYLDEADELSDHLAIMDCGKIVVEGTPLKLKKDISGDVITLKQKNLHSLANIVKLLQNQIFVREIQCDEETIYLYVEDGTKAMPYIFSLLDKENIVLETISLSQPSLDDVFLKKTGRLLRDAAKEGQK